MLSKYNRSCVFPHYIFNKFRWISYLFKQMMFNYAGLQRTNVADIGNTFLQATYEQLPTLCFIVYCVKRLATLMWCNCQSVCLSSSVRSVISVLTEFSKHSALCHIYFTLRKPLLCWVSVFVSCLNYEEL